MNKAKAIRLLREIAEEAKLTYLAKAVNVKLLRQEVLAMRKKVLSEQSNGSPPSTTEREAGISSKQYKPMGNFSEFPKPEELEFEIEDILDNDTALKPTGQVVRLVMGSGPGTYRKLLGDYKAAIASANSSKSQSASIDDIVANLLMPNRSEEDSRKLRSAAARLLRSARKPASSLVTAPTGKAKPVNVSQAAKLAA